MAGIAVICGAAWLNFPSSAGLFVQGLVAQRHPVTFDFEFQNDPQARSGIDVTFQYVPKTPILGISEHYWSIIAPFQVDTIERRQHVIVDSGHVRFEAPLALVGLSNFRLNVVTLGQNFGSDESTVLGLSETNGGSPPVALTIPLAGLREGTYEFEGPLALWKMTGASENEGGRVYSPLGSNPTRQVIWPSLSAVHARVDLAAYPVPTFQPPVGWAREGWHAYGINLTRPGATLTDKLLTTRHGAAVLIPFRRDCSAVPRFALVPAREKPSWADDAALWRPVSKTTWNTLVQTHPAHAPAIAFVAAAKPPADGVEAVRVGSLQRGMYRLFGACPTARYDSVAVAWIDISAV